MTKRCLCFFAMSMPSAPASTAALDPYPHAFDEVRIVDYRGGDARIMVRTAVICSSGIGTGSAIDAHKACHTDSFQHCDSVL